MQPRTNKIGIHLLALGAAVAVNVALIHALAESRMKPWPAVFADASAKPAEPPVATMTQQTASGHVEQVVVVARRGGAREGVAMAQMPTPPSQDCPTRL